MEIRNFVIIAHIDHGKSTLADRMLELTHTIEDRKMREQVLDQMDLERERGITIKMQPVRMKYKAAGADHILNLIDTPGHADFSYEVSRSLAAVEGAVLLVDATQGIQAQTIANLNFALAEGLTIIPAVNKVDLPNARVEESRAELATLLECDPGNVALLSGKTGLGVPELLERIRREIPPPQPGGEKFRALIFDSQFDQYKGVILHIRVTDGSLRRGERVSLVRSEKEADVLELGHFLPAMSPAESLQEGEIGYLATGLKEAGIRIGDTVIHERDREVGIESLPGYRKPHPVVFASVYPTDADDFPELKEALEKLKLNDASLFYEIEASEALGRGFRAGFLGMLHLEIVSERIRREFGLEIIVSTPSVSYEVKLKQGEIRTVYSAADIPDEQYLQEIHEPWVRLEVVAPAERLGKILKLFETIRAKFLETRYLSETRVLVLYRIPLKEVIIDLYDRLKSATSGYASMGYEFEGYQKENLVRLDIMVAGKRERAFSVVVTKDEAYAEGKRIVEKLKSLLPLQVFAVPIQAAIGGTVIARETLKAMSKDVTGYLYGGDRTRKMKLWKKQKKGKKRLAEQGMGSVEIPPEVFVKMLKRSE